MKGLHCIVITLCVYCFLITFVDSGQWGDAQKLLGAWIQAWSQMGGLAELFDMAAKERHPLQKVT